MFSRIMALRLFEAFSIQRWNDKIRPIELTEMDKQGFKTMLTYIFAKIEEYNGKIIDWEYLVYGSVFALMKNIVLSDIKSPVIKSIKDNYPDEFKKLNKWAVDQYRPLIVDEDFLNRFDSFINETDPKDDFHLKILRAAHKYSTYREFEIIQAFNTKVPDIRRLELELISDLVKNKEIKGLSEILEEKELAKGVFLIEQLRFQTRWSQTQRIPKTTVMGHSMLVACFMLLLSREINACPTRLVNNFFAGLFHDLPEAVVRDIISPVKKATEQLPEIIKEIEEEVCEKELFPMFPDYIRDHLYYLTAYKMIGGDEFSNRIRYNGKVKVLENGDLTLYNENKFDLIDGELVKLADEISAFIEADQSIRHGITSRHLQEGAAGIRSKYLAKKRVSSIAVESFFMEFN